MPGAHRLGPRRWWGATHALLLAALLACATPGTAVAPVAVAHRLDCADFRRPAEAHAWFVSVRTLARINPWGLDGNGDGVAC